MIDLLSLIRWRLHSGLGRLNCLICFQFNFGLGKLIHSDENARKIVGFLGLKVKQTQGNLSEKLFYVKSSFYHPFSPGMQNCE